MLLVDRDEDAVNSLFQLIHIIRVVYTDQIQKSKFKRDGWLRH